MFNFACRIYWTKGRIRINYCYIGIWLKELLFRISKEYRYYFTFRLFVNKIFLYKIFSLKYFPRLNRENKKRKHSSTILCICIVHLNL